MNSFGIRWEPHIGTIPMNKAALQDDGNAFHAKIAFSVFGPDATKKTASNERLEFTVKEGAGAMSKNDRHEAHAGSLHFVAFTHPASSATVNALGSVDNVLDVFVKGDASQGAAKDLYLRRFVGSMALPIDQILQFFQEHIGALHTSIHANVKAQVAKAVPTTHNILRGAAAAGNFTQQLRRIQSIVRSGEISDDGSPLVSDFPAQDRPHSSVGSPLGLCPAKEVHGELLQENHGLLAQRRRSRLTVTVETHHQQICYHQVHHTFGQVPLPLVVRVEILQALQKGGIRRCSIRLLLPFPHFLKLLPQRRKTRQPIEHLQQRFLDIFPCQQPVRSQSLVVPPFTSWYLTP